MDDPRKNTDGDDPFALDPALQEKARRWFAEAREQTKRDDEEIAAWRSDSRPTGGDGGSGGFGGDFGGGDCGGGD